MDGDKEMAIEGSLELDFDDSRTRVHEYMPDATDVRGSARILKVLNSAQPWAWAARN